MRLNEIVAWYQKKIGTYDKQQWEKTVEQRILHGFTSVPLKNTTLKTELIDVDLVRGSSFPKAKPKQTLITVLRYAVLRFIFLPLYARWWVEQTSPKVFSFLLFVYLVQMFNWSVYSFNVNRLGADAIHIVSISELLIPIALSFILSVIHSQIVATSSNVSKAEKRRQRHLQPKRKKRERVKRRKKNIRIRSTTSETKSSANLDVSGSIVTSLADKLNINTSPIKISLTLNKNTSQPLHHQQTLNPASSATSSISSNTNLINLSANSTLHKHDFEISVESTQKSSTQSLNYINKLELGTKTINSNNQSCDKLSNSPRNDLNNSLTSLDNGSSQFLRKRNVNWDSPIKSQFMHSNFDDLDYYSATPLNSNNVDNHVVMESVVEYYNELVVKTENDVILLENNENADNRHNVSEQTGEDDGFESLNGKSSSGEENNINNNIGVELPTLEPYRNAWVRDNNEIGINSKSDSDTDTLKHGQSTDLISATIKSTSPSTSTIKSTKTSRIPLSSESDLDFIRFKQKSLSSNLYKNYMNSHPKKDQKPNTVGNDSSDIDEEENEDCETISGSTPGGTNSNPNFTEGTTSATEWIGVTTNSEESYSSEMNQHSDSCNSENCLEYDFTPTVILNPACGSVDRISCTIWDRRETKKAQMSVLDISSAIIEKVEAMPETCDYIYIGVAFSIILSLVPAFCRLCEATIDSNNATDFNFFEIHVILLEKASFSYIQILLFAFGDSDWENIVLTVSMLLRLCLTFLFFFLLAVAERTFKQRFLYAKLFSHLTSSRRARKSALPHFRLNKVRNIKTWLSVRSYLKRRGPQRSVDVIVSAAFILTLLLLAFLSVEWLKESVHLHSQYNLESLLWSFALGIFILRFMTLGTKINRKYRSISVLITEQINLYLQIEQKPNKKEELMVSNCVLKLAADLLKELESPFKISGLSANPFLYTTIKVVILSALSGVLSEILGFKLKLHKIKIK